LSKEINNKLEILSLPYTDRQIIVVTADELAEATQYEGKKALHAQSNGVDWRRIAEVAILDVVPIPFSNLLVEISKEAIQSWGRARESGVGVMAIGKSVAKNLSFPPGHPREGLIYIGHPTLNTAYYPMAEFHRVIFEHKFCEAIELLMALGATKIKVEHVKGWSKDFSGRISAPLGSTCNIKSETESKENKASSLLYEANLVGLNNPVIPESLVWFNHEPTWQSIAKGRINYGLQNFSLSISYEDDFGVNAGLKASVLKSGLDIGGKFEDHQSTVWRLEGEFLPKA
jgi:hypothetical protein